MDYEVDAEVNRYDSIGAPLAHWKLNETAGSEASDAAGDFGGKPFFRNHFIFSPQSATL